jgi:hypothetical protein
VNSQEGEPLDADKLEELREAEAKKEKKTLLENVAFFPKSAIRTVVDCVVDCAVDCAEDCAVDCAEDCVVDCVIDRVVRVDCKTY